MTSVLDHRKFSRGEPGGNAIELMDPLPDHSWDVPPSQSQPPVGPVEGPTVSIVGGERVEHYPNQHAAVNVMLMEAVLEASKGAMQLHEAAMASTAEHRAQQTHHNGVLVTKVLEYAKGVAVHAASMSTDSKPTPLFISEACQIATKMTELDDLIREELSQDALRTSFANLNLLVDGVKDSQPLSKAARHDLETMCAKSYGDATVGVLSNGMRLVATDAFAFLNSELQETEGQAARLTSATQVVKARRDAAVLMDSYDEADMHGFEELDTLAQLLEVTSQRLTAISLSKGEIDEFHEEVVQWKSGAVSHVRGAVKEVEAKKKSLQGDVRRLLTGRSVQKAVSNDHADRFAERKSRMIAKIKENSKRQDEVFTSMCAELAKLPGIQMERQHLLQAFAKDVEDEALRVMRFNSWIDKNDTVKAKFETCLAQQCLLHASLQQISQEIVPSLCTAADDLSVRSTLQDIKRTEGKQALELHERFAMLCGSMLSQKETRQTLLQHTQQQFAKSLGLTGASATAAATVGIENELETLAAEVSRLRDLQDEVHPKYRLVSTLCDEAQYLHDNPYTAAAERARANAREAVETFDDRVEMEMKRATAAAAMPS